MSLLSKYYENLQKVKAEESLLGKYYENLQKVKAEENKGIFTQNEKSTTSTTSTTTTDEKIILPSASHHPLIKFVSVANTNTQTVPSSSPIVITIRDPTLTNQLNTRDPTLTCQLSSRDPTLTSQLSMKNPTLTSQLSTRDPCLTSQLLAKATNVHGTITHGKVVQSPTQGHELQPLTQGHILQLPSQGHGVRLPTHGHMVQQPTQGGVVQVPTPTFVVQLAAQGRSVQLPTQGHFVKLSTQGHLVQLISQGHGVKIVTQGHLKKLPNQDHGVKLPTQGHLMQLPTQGHLMQLPTQGHLMQLPTQGHGVMLPTQGHLEQLPAQGHLEQLPAQDHLEQLPTQGHLVQLPTQGHGVKLPTQGHLVQLLTQSHGVKLPTQGHVGHLTTQGYGLQLPAQGRVVQLPTQGLIFQLPIQGHGNQLSTIGNGMHLPTEGQRVQIPTEGHGVQLPFRWAPIQPISSYSLRIQQYRKAKSYPKKRKTHRPKRRAFLLSLDEYYYGRLEGDPNYQEEKDSFRFECSHCGKVLYNNIRTMQHINRHLYPEWVDDLESGNLSGCPQCNRDFDNPFEMQTHYDKDHLKKDNPQCRICEKKCNKGYIYTHMEKQHNICEMPYICQLCKFRSSMHSDVIHHFVTKHNSSEFLLCLLCLCVIRRQRPKEYSRSKQNYYQHLKSHGLPRKGLGCQRCKLIFRTRMELVVHRQKDHLPYQERVNAIEAQCSAPGRVEKESENVRGISSLNAPAVRKCMDNELILPPGVSKLACIECKRPIGIPDHFRRHSCCSLCRFATNCSFAFANHVMTSHCGQLTGATSHCGQLTGATSHRGQLTGTTSHRGQLTGATSHRGQLTGATSHTPNPGRIEEQFYCACGFVSSYGNLIANHLVACSKTSCSKYVCPASALEELDQDIEIKEEIESGDETNMGDKGADGYMSDNDGEVKYSYTQAFSDVVDEDKHRYTKALSDIVNEDKLKQEVKEEVATEIIQDTDEFS